MEEGKRSILFALFKVNPHISNKEAAKIAGVHRNTASTYRKTFLQSSTSSIVKRKPGCGRKLNRKILAKVIHSLKRNPGTSDGDRAKKLRIPAWTVRRYRIKAGYKAYTAKKRPNRNEKQEKVAKTRARLLYDKVLTKHGGCLLMDDETYVKTDFKQIPRQKFYYSQIRGNVPKKYKHILIDKYARKYMIWQGLCSCGLKTRAFVTTLNVSSDLYQKECLEKRLLPLIRKHQVPVKFWPDLASCHYSKSTMKFYEDNNIDVVPKNFNPPNSPELRPIERYWAIMKAKLFKNGGVVKTTAELLQRWNRYAATVTNSSVQGLMGSILESTCLKQQFSSSHSESYENRGNLEKTSWKCIANSGS
jgi:hypothetical protein